MATINTAQKIAAATHILIGEPDRLQEVLQLGDGAVGVHHALKHQLDLRHGLLTGDHEVFLWEGGWGEAVTHPLGGLGQLLGYLCSYRNTFHH